MTITQYPTSIHAAFNPIIFSVSDVSETEVTMVVNINGDTIERMREVLTLAIFDLSSVVSRGFKNEQLQILPGLIFKDKNLYVDYSVLVAGTTFYLTAVNAVVQIGETSDLTTKKGSFLTNLDKLIKYPNYYMDISCMAFDASTYVGHNGSVINGDTPINNTPLFTTVVPDNVGYVSIFNNSLFDELTTDAGEVITNNNGDIILVSIPSGGYTEARMNIETRCLPESPFYVRWINQQGGWDYWMFSYRQIIERDTTNKQLFNPTVYNQQQADSFSELIYQEGEETITAGANGLSENEYECISKLVYSPKIQWYKENIGKWLTITVDKGDNENDTHVVSKNIEFTFNLPKPQLQF